MDWDLRYKHLIKKIVYKCNKCIMHRYECCRGTATLKDFLDQELIKHEDDQKFNYCKWDSTNRALLTAFTATYEGNKDTLIDVIDDLTTHFYIAKLKLTNFMLHDEI